MSNAGRTRTVQSAMSMVTAFVLNAVTLVAGHLLSGRRRTAYGFLAAVVGLPLAVIAGQAIWVLLKMPEFSNTDLIGASLFVLGAVTLSTSSTFLLWRHHRASKTPLVHLSGSRLAEFILVSFLSLVLICGSAISFIVIPFAGEPGVVASKVPSVLGKRIPPVGGSVALTGQVLVAGAPAAGITFVFLFSDDYVSPDIVTDTEGRFRYVLPPGTWRLRSPFVPSETTRDIRFQFDKLLPPGDQGITFSVSPGQVTNTYSMTIELG